MKRTSDSNLRVTDRGEMDGIMRGADAQTRTRRRAALASPDDRNAVERPWDCANTEVTA
jgi:hypothetical protein